jgi:hypothetical protein
MFFDVQIPPVVVYGYRHPYFFGIAWIYTCLFLLGLANAVTVVSSEDRGKSDNRGMAYRGNEVQGRNQVMLVVPQIWRTKIRSRIWEEGCIRSWVRFGCIMEQVNVGDDGRKCCI